MNSNVWAKTTLFSYPYLVKLADSIDRMIEKKALYSFHVTSSNFASNNIYDLAQKIIDLTQRKITLINLKVLIENALKKCPREQAKLLIAKYISKKKSGEICQMFDLPSRTYFRRVFDAEVRFEKELCRLGYPPSKLCDFLKDESWIINTKMRFEHLKGDQTISFNPIGRSAYALI